MNNWYAPTDAAAVLGRLEKLSPDATPRWGRLTPRELMCHLADPVRVAIGEKTVARIASPLSLPGLAPLTVWLLPWPKGAPTAPEFLPGTGMTSPTEFERDKQTLVELLRRFSEFPADRPLAPSPVFGPLDRKAWGRLMWRHLDHHLAQFGL